MTCAAHEIHCSAANTEIARFGGSSLFMMAAGEMFNCEGYACKTVNLGVDGVEINNGVNVAVPGSRDFGIA